MSLNKRRDAFFMDDGEYDDDGGDGADCDDGEYVDEEGIGYNEDNEDDEIKYEKSTTRGVNKSGRASTRGRQLKRWDVDEDQLLLLYCDYVTTQMGQPIPWNEIAAEFEPRDPASGKLAMTGEAIKQHLNKLHRHRTLQGFRVPPKLDRNARRKAASTFAAKMASAFQTPTSTPKKRGSGGSAAKPSTLLASVSKAKQLKAEKAKKAAAGVAKPTSAKRGRKTTSESLSGKGREILITKKKVRPGLEGLVSIGGNLKSELQSDDDDLPISKKTKAKKVGSGLMSDTLAIWEGRHDTKSPVIASPIQYGDADSPVVASPPRYGGAKSLIVAPPTQYGDTSPFALPGIVPSQNDNAAWSYSVSGDNSMGFNYPANNFFDPFGTVAPQPFSGFAGLPAFPIQASGFTYPDPFQNLGMMPLSGQMPMPGYYTSFSQQTIADPASSSTDPLPSFTDPASSTTNSAPSFTYPPSSFMDSSVTDSGAVPMDHSQFLDQQLDEEDFEAPPVYLTDAYGADDCAN